MHAYTKRYEYHNLRSNLKCELHGVPKNLTLQITYCKNLNGRYHNRLECPWKADTTVCPARCDELILTIKLVEDAHALTNSHRGVEMTMAIVG